MNNFRNPFKASLGSSPPFLAGRHREIQSFSDALYDGPGAHERISLVTGLRGVGKTVLLNEFEQQARGHSWWVISETATEGFTDRIRDEVYRVTVENLRTDKRFISGVTLPLKLGGAQFENREIHHPTLDLRRALSDLLDLQAEVDRKLGQDPVGVFISVDELHHNRRDEMLYFGAVVQHLVREGREIAVAMAGIPQAIKPLLASDEGRNPVTFLRRANKIELGFIEERHVAQALSEPLSRVGVKWEGQALQRAVQACGGYAFMTQLVGSECFRNREGTTITEHAVDIASVAARKKLGQLVHAPALEDLSNVDRTFLAAMALDDGPSKMGDISTRLGVDAQYAGTYRRRLLEAEMISSAQYGYVDFALPYMRAYLREHAVTEAFETLATGEY